MEQTLFWTDFIERLLSADTYTAFTEKLMKTFILTLIFFIKLELPNSIIDVGLLLLCRKNGPTKKTQPTYQYVHILYATIIIYT